MSSESSSASVGSGHTNRRAFLVGAGATALGAEFFADLPLAQAQTRLTKGDEAILRFLSAAEILETDLWQQYNELGGIQDSEVPGGSGNAAYTAALSMLDSDMAQYIHDNTEDEFTISRSSTRTCSRAADAPVNLGQVQDAAEQQGDAARSRSSA